MTIAEHMAETLRKLAEQRWAAVYEHDTFFRAVAAELERLAQKQNAGDRCHKCKEPLPPLEQWSTPFCPACTCGAEKP